MFYQYSDELTTIEPQDRDPNLVCAAYITLAELDTHYEKFGFSPSTVQQCKEENRYFRSNIEVYDDYSFGTLKITDAANAPAREESQAFYVKKNLMLLKLQQMHIGNYLLFCIGMMTMLGQLT